MLYQIAWLELDGGKWRFLTDVSSHPNKASRIWSDKSVALEELQQEGWVIIGSYQNWLSRKLKIPQMLRGYGLVRTIH